jgi:dCTP deaminase
MATSGKDLFGETAGSDEHAHEAGDISLYGGRAGLVPDSIIRALIVHKHILAPGNDIRSDQIQPASLDLRLGARGYRIRGSFLPKSGSSIETRLHALADHEFSLADGAVLERDCVYLIPLQEQLDLPPLYSASANPKSSTGRLDIFTRLVADGAESFDTVPAGHHGPLHAEVSPRTFPVKVRAGSRLLQMRFRRRNSQQPVTPTFFLKDSELADLDRRLRDELGAGLVDGEMRARDGLMLSVSLKHIDASRRVGFRARRYSPPIDFDRTDYLSLEDYWDPIHQPPRGQIILDPNEFYILKSHEAVQVPPSHAAEMVPIDPTMGEFRVHYAGFFDPGFGHSPAGGSGSRAVLEVRSHEVPFVLEDMQPIGRLRYEPLVAPPSRIYGTDIGSHYQAQGLKLSKHFRAE